MSLLWKTFFLKAILCRLLLKRLSRGVSYRENGAGDFLAREIDSSQACVRRVVRPLGRSGRAWVATATNLYRSPPAFQ